MLDVFDHVGLSVSDLEASHRCYELALAELGYGEPYSGPNIFEWEDLAISEARGDRPVTRNLQLALVASSRERRVFAAPIPASVQVLPCVVPAGCRMKPHERHTDVTPIVLGARG